MEIHDLMATLREDPEHIFNLSPLDFEKVIGEVLVSMGWEVSGTRRGPDRGIDLLGISRDAAEIETSWAIELKHHTRERKVGIAAVRQARGVAQMLGLQRAMLATTSGLTRDAADEASATGVFVADWEVISGWISNYEAPTSELPHTATRHFRSCFVSHSHKDHSFAARLVRRLRADGVRVWFAPEDLQPGQRINEEVGKAINTFDRLVLVLSENSMDSHWVQSEVRRARQRELDERARVLFPLSLVPFEVVRGWELFDSDLGQDLAAVVREYFIPDFSGWEDESRFEEQTEALLMGLQADP